MLKIKFFFTCAGAFLASFAFTACGDEDSSSSLTKDVDYVWNTADDKVKCEKTLSGKIAYYEPDDAVLICEYDEDSDEWTWTEYVDGDDAESKRSSSSSKSRSSVKDGSEYDSTANTLTDKRDGQVYKTVKIGNQTWMAENLNYNYRKKSLNFCYENKPDSCAKYGRLYTWGAAMDSAAVFSDDGKDCGYPYASHGPCEVTGTVRGVCPEGWHLPDLTEWKTLFDAVGGERFAALMLKSQTGWKSYSGTLLACHSGEPSVDAYGFSVLPAGEWGCKDSFSPNGNFRIIGNQARFWTSSMYGDFYSYFIYLDYCDSAGWNSSGERCQAFSVRCLKD